MHERLSEQNRNRQIIQKKEVEKRNSSNKTPDYLVDNKLVPNHRSEGLLRMPTV